ncbi:MAG: hypothetical protein A2X78_01985 [Gammaproteobacteria bacterium GWE2_37_16]|nr:MAG: hypothetical protein A2X78_01985 [Gammaproteobacteria bacterium GWE2_37_16]
MKTYLNFCTNLTEQIFNIIDEKGSLLKWQKNWDGEGTKGLPCGGSGFYHGANLLSLLCAQWKYGFKNNSWLILLQFSGHSE